MANMLERLVFIDETSLKTNLIKTTGWAPGRPTPDRPCALQSLAHPVRGSARSALKSVRRTDFRARHTLHRGPCAGRSDRPLGSGRGQEPRQFRPLHQAPTRPGAAARADQGKQDRLGQPLEVDRCGGAEGLDFRVFAAASGGSGHCVECFGQPVGTLDRPAVAAVEAGFGLTQGPSFAPGAQHVNMVFGDMDAPCGPAIRNALRPQWASPAGVWTGPEPSA